MSHLPQARPAVAVCSVLSLLAASCGSTAPSRTADRPLEGKVIAVCGTKNTTPVVSVSVRRLPPVAGITKYEATLVSNPSAKGPLTREAIYEFTPTTIEIRLKSGEPRGFEDINTIVDIKGTRPAPPPGQAVPGTSPALVLRPNVPFKATLNSEMLALKEIPVECRVLAQ